MLRFSQLCKLTPELHHLSELSTYLPKNEVGLSFPVIIQIKILNMVTYGYKYLSLIHVACKS
jgi:hypothetical protein